MGGEVLKYMRGSTNETTLNQNNSFRNKNKTEKTKNNYIFNVVKFILISGVVLDLVALDARVL